MSAISHAERMDGIYRGQKHIYDATRKYFLLGRDHLIDGLDAQPGSSVLELGCGTGRNLVLAAHAYPQARLFGLDISAEMLKTAERSVARAGCTAHLARGDASVFDPEQLFGEPAFDRIFISYALSMIPPWQETLSHSLGLLAPGGSLHIVDFGQQERLPRPFKTALNGWLQRFHVTPRATLFETVADEADKHGAKAVCTPLYRDYAWHAVVQMA